MRRAALVAASALSPWWSSASCRPAATSRARRQPARSTSTPPLAARSRAPRRRSPRCTTSRSELLGGGPAAFDAPLEALRGHPVVINKWASWCGPCRFEFPFFQRVAASAARRSPSSASTRRQPRRAEFLRDIPLPYPSYVDPDERIAASIDAPANYPVTVFFDARGQDRLRPPGRLPTRPSARGRHRALLGRR